MRGPLSQEKGRYELRGFVRNKRGNYTRVRTLTIREDDPHYMAAEMWRIEHDLIARDPRWRIEVRDLGEKRRPRRIAPLVSYNELVSRSRNPQHSRTR
jgi:hypothetical protein